MEEMITEPLRIRVGSHVTIYPLGKRHIYYADFWHAGEHKRQSLKTRNLKLARQRAVARDNDLNKGTFKAPAPPSTIHKAVAKYLEFLTIEGKAPNTIV